MPTAEYASLSAVTVGASELSVVSGSTSLPSKTDNGIYGLWIDPVTNMAKSDYFKVRVYEKVLSGGTKRVVFQAVIGNAQVEPWVLPSLMLKHGWDMTLQKVAGTDRAFDASIRGAAGTITEAYSINGVTVGASELSIASGTTSLQTKAEPGVYQLVVDPVAAAMAKADEFAVRIYEKVKGGTKRQVLEATLHDVQTQLYVSPMLTLANGWDMTLQKVAGTDRSFSASIRKVA